MIIFKLTYGILVAILYILIHVSINALTSLLTPTKFQSYIKQKTNHPLPSLSNLNLHSSSYSAHNLSKLHHTTTNILCLARNVSSVPWKTKTILTPKFPTPEKSNNIYIQGKTNK